MAEPATELGAVIKAQFAQVPEWVATHPDVLGSPTALAVYVHLNLLGNFKTRVTTSDWREITDATGWSKPTVMRAMKVLRDAGAMVREGANVRLPMDVSSLISDTRLIESSIKSDAVESQIRDESVSDLRSVPLFTENSEISHRTTRANFDDDFDALWKHYPRKVSKERAHKTYVAARRKGATADDLLMAVLNYAASRDGEELKYTLHAGTFLNGDWREWLDDGAAQVEATHVLSLKRRRGEPTSGPTKAQAIDQLLHGSRNVPKQPQLHEGRSA